MISDIRTTEDKILGQILGCQILLTLLLLLLLLLLLMLLCRPLNDQMIR